ncbi:hypothetical protein [Candidatus Phycosocius spiralis]|uniref:Uncharacterized protein n=1 Tax=Candidatus Phycosocius spiralis TaxID=2815099 RepID=A0ABQ4PYA6_9PROT|nr:hypothetical protein [Candidatus Phycosocius spiralis]GIU68047.1 hypothetical protein PsB1_2201 [Candidatus Phycosocius spiralis]
MIWLLSLVVNNWIKSIALVMAATAIPHSSTTTSLFTGHEAGINWVRVSASVVIGILASLGAIYFVAVKSRIRGLGVTSLNLPPIWKVNGEESVTIVAYKKISPSLEIVKLRDMNTEYLLAVGIGGTIILNQTAYGDQTSGEKSQREKSRLETVEQ